MPLFAYSIATSINIIVNLLVTSPGRPFAADLVIIDIVDIIPIQAATGAVFPIVPASSITALVCVNIFPFVTLNPSICFIFQISTLACIRTFVLETRLEEFLNGPTMREPLEVAVAFTSLEYKCYREKELILVLKNTYRSDYLAYNLFRLMVPQYRAVEPCLSGKVPDRKSVV